MSAQFKDIIFSRKVIEPTAFILGGYAASSIFAGSINPTDILQSQIENLSNIFNDNRSIIDKLKGQLREKYNVTETLSATAFLTGVYFGGTEAFKSIRKNNSPTSNI
jgi:hypothetical protein